MSQSSLIAIDQICEYLEKVIRHLPEQSGSKYRFDEYDQAAVRLLQSKQRYFRRQWDAQYGDLRQQGRARVELRLAEQDTGVIVRLYGRNHVVGWLGCRACENDNGSLARLCPHCSKGIQHACVVIEEGEPEEGPGGWVVMSGGTLKRAERVEGISNVLPEAKNLTTSQLKASTAIPAAPPKRIFSCEHCKVEDIEV